MVNCSVVPGSTKTLQTVHLKDRMTKPYKLGHFKRPGHYRRASQWTMYYCSRFPICQHFQTRPPVESGADRETLSLGDAESLYIMFCACFRFFHGNPSYSKQLCAAQAPLIPVATKHNGCHGSGSVPSHFALMLERSDEGDLSKMSKSFS